MKTLIMTAALSTALVAAGSLGAAAQELTVRESPEHGQYIADGEGMALYMFEADTRGEGDTQAETTCFDDCAGAWPPLTGDDPQAGENVQSDLIGTIERDGEMQVTYGGWPLYYFVRDEAAGDTAGHDVEGFGAEWYLVGPDGEAIGH